MENHYIKAFKKLLHDKKLDAVIIYANTYDDKFFKAIAEVPSVMENYILITHDEVYLSVLRYLVTSTKEKTNIPILSAQSEEELIMPFIPFLGKKKKLGVVGNVKYADVMKLEASIIVKLDYEAARIIRYKSDEYIKNLARIAALQSKFFNAIHVESGMSQMQLLCKFNLWRVKHGYELAFPVCITSGKDLYMSTSLLPQEKIVGIHDMVCLDAGVSTDIYTTDITRMYFAKGAKAKEYYEQIKLLHDELIMKLPFGKSYQEFFEIYEKTFTKLSFVQRVQGLGYGHGVGFGLHERPFIGEPDVMIESNTIFTIEPAFVTEFGLMRIEDMVGIYSNTKIEKIS